IFNIVRICNNIRTCIDCLGKTFCLTMLLHAPAHIVNNTAVAIDIAFESKLPAKNMIQEIVIESKTDLFKRNIFAFKLLNNTFLDAWYRVVRHDGGCSMLCCCSKWWKMILF